MTRALALAGFLLRDLHRSPAGAAPYGVAAALWWLTFYYPVTADYLGAVGGWDLAIVALVAALALAGRADRAAFLPVVARMRRRSELLAAVSLAAGAVVVLVGACFAAVMVLTGRLSEGSMSAPWVAPRWALVAALAIAAGLNLSRLAARGNSNLAFAALGAGLATVTAWRGLLPAEAAWLGSAAGSIAGPVTSLLAGGAAPPDLTAAAVVAGYVALLLAVAGLSFGSKDLTWSE